MEYFQELADGAPVMIWMSGHDMGCFYFNRAWLDYRGRTTEQEFGNGWAEGVHPEDLQRCVQHYIGSFERRVPFAMSYRLQHRSGEYRWILDRGSPHHSASGQFLGFFGGCAEVSGDTPIPRITDLRQSLSQMRHFAERLAAAEADSLPQSPWSSENPPVKVGRLHLERFTRQHAAVQLGQLAGDMLRYHNIPNGALLR